MFSSSYLFLVWWWRLWIFCGKETAYKNVRLPLDCRLVFSRGRWSVPLVGPVGRSRRLAVVIVASQIARCVSWLPIRQYWRCKHKNKCGISCNLVYILLYIENTTAMTQLTYLLLPFNFVFFFFVFFLSFQFSWFLWFPAVSLSFPLVWPWVWRNCDRCNSHLRSPFLSTDQYDEVVLCFTLFTHMCVLWRRFGGVVSFLFSFRVLYCTLYSVHV